MYAKKFLVFYLFVLLLLVVEKIQKYNQLTEL